MWGQPREGSTPFTRTIDISSGVTGHGGAAVLIAAVSYLATMRPVIMPHGLDIM